MTTQDTAAESGSDEQSEPDSRTTGNTAKKTGAAKKSPAKKSTAKKSTTKRSTAKKSPAKKAPAKKTTRSRSGSDAPRAHVPQKKTASMIAAMAARQLLELTGKDPEGITGLERTDDGWSVMVEVLEVRRIPDTTDILALYEVEVDTDGDMLGYHRVRRYTRGAPGEE